MFPVDPTMATLTVWAAGVLGGEGDGAAGVLMDEPPPQFQNATAAAVANTTPVNIERMVKPPEWTYEHRDSKGSTVDNSLTFNKLRRCLLQAP